MTHLGYYWVFTQIPLRSTLSAVFYLLQYLWSSQFRKDYFRKRLFHSRFKINSKARGWFSLLKLISLYSMLLSSKSLYHVDETSHAKHYQLRLRCFIRVVSRFDIIVVSRAGNISQICDVMAKEIDPFISLLITLKYQNVCADLQNCNISITFHSIWVVLT